MQQYDVIVVGGGIVGAIAACGLGQAGFKVAIVEAAARSHATDRGQAYSINLCSAQIFEDLGLWDQIRPQIETYRSVHLSDGNYHKIVKFSPTDIQQETIGFVAEHRVLLTALESELERLPTVTRICPATVISTTRNQNQTLVTIQQNSPHSSNAAQPSNPMVQQLSTALVIAADGQRSPLRQAAQIKTLGWKYWQSCIVAFIKPEYPHEQIAYERFQTDGPFAILPLPNGLCRIVWTALNRDVDRILSLSSEEFMQELVDRYGDHMGALTVVGEVSVFPVQLLHSTSYVKPGLALIGDAAHCCHPVGGQGINLGIRDAAALVSILKKAHHNHVDFGNLSILKQYERWRMWENLIVLGLTDTLTRLFSNKILPIVVLRRISLWMLQHISPIRSLVLRLMQGLMGRSPRLTPGPSNTMLEKRNHVNVRRTLAS